MHKVMGSTVVVESIPLKLQEHAQWVLWRWQNRGGKRTKPPFRPDGSRARSNDLRTWTTFERAVEAFETGRFDGIGFALAADDPYVAFDLDHCRDPNSGEFDTWAKEVVSTLDSYTEVTPSREGLRVLVRANLPDGRRKTAIRGGRQGAALEVYDTGRYVTITGLHLEGTPATIQERDAQVQAVYSEFLHHRSQPDEPTKTAFTGLTDDEETVKRAAAAKNGVKFGRLWSGDTTGYPSPSEADLALCAILAYWTKGDAARIDQLFRQSGLYRPKWNEVHGGDGRTYGRMTIAEALKGIPTDRAASDTQRPNRPSILTTNRQLREMAAEALRALQCANDPPVIFQRTGQLVRVDHDEESRPLITALGDAHLRGHLTRAADFFRLMKDEERRPTAPPFPVVRDILTLREWPFPPLVGLTEAPVLRPDGSVVIQPGYDAVTRLFYVPAPGLVLPTLADASYEMDAQDAVQTLDEALGDFPFADGASRANAFGLLLTPIVRPMIPGRIPLTILDAPKQGSGKTLLADVVAVIATGREGAMMDASDHDEEWDKRITAVLKEGASVVLIDNVSDVLRAPSLSRALTCGRWSGRVLGRSEMVDLPQRAAWIATGNNVQIAGDMPRRCTWIRLDPKCARPWERSGFVHEPLLPWVQENRGRLLGALLAMARAWVAAGRPLTKGLPVLGSFEEWAGVVGSILAHAGVEGFLANTTAFQNRHGTEEMEWEAFLLAWREAFGRGAVTVAEVVRILDGEDDPAGPRMGSNHLPGDLAYAWSRQASGHGGSFTRKLGKALSLREGTRFGESGVHVVRDGERKRSVSWRVVSLATEHGDS